MPRLITDINDQLEVTVGLDWRTAKIEHYRKFTVFLVATTTTILAIKTFLELVITSKSAIRLNIMT